MNDSRLASPEPGEYLAQHRGGEKIITTREIIPTLVGAIRESDEPVIVQCMHLDFTQEVTQPLIAEIAQQRELNPERSITISTGRAHIKPDDVRIINYLYSINRWSNENGTGLRMIYTGTPNLNPWAGHNHIKIFQVGDKTWIGGINLHKQVLNGWDLMVELDDPEVAAFARAIVNGGINGNLTHHINGYELLVDGGKPGSSVILPRAVEEIDSAQHSIIYINQFFPDSPVFEALLNARNRGTDVTMIRSHPNTFDHIAYKLTHYLRPLKLKAARDAGIEERLIEDRFVHGKIIIVDGSTAIIGSSNYVQRGVEWGTKEFNIVIRDKNLINTLVQTITRDLLQEDRQLGYSEEPSYSSHTAEVG